MVAARLVTTKKGDNQFTKDTQICVSSQPEAATALKVSTRSASGVCALVGHPGREKQGCGYQTR